MTDRDEAVRVVAETLVRACEEPPEVAAEDAILAASIIDGTVTEVYAPPLSAGRAAVDALIAVGWGDLAAERERLAAAVEAHRHHDLTWPSSIAYNAGLDNAARLIREDTP
jgi:hypothetical protein